MAMQKLLLPALLLSLLLTGPLAAQQKNEASAPNSDNRAQVASAERGMNQLAKDWIDAISKIAGVLGLFVAIFVAANTAKKYRVEREAQRTMEELQRTKEEAQRKKEMEQKEKELQETQTNSKIRNAQFWLELRKMFTQHDEIHLKLRGEEGKNWSARGSAPLTKESKESAKESKEWAKLEAYMGFLEHIQRIRSYGLIDTETFKSIYGYRVKNILANSEIVREKLIKLFTGWEDLIKLIRELGYQELLITTASKWLSSEDGKLWLVTENGRLWLATDEGKRWSTLRAQEK